MLKVTLDANKIKKNDLFRWADFVELSCLDDPDGEAPLSEVLREAWGYETGFGAIYREDDFIEGTEDSENKKRPTYEDNIQTKTEDLLNHFEMRLELLEDQYPFEVNRTELVLCRKKKQPAHNLYIYLLFASNLPFLSSQDNSSLTKGFERLAYRAIKNLMPTNATIALFGTAATKQYKSYQGNKYKKICSFATDLSASVNIDSTTYQSKDSGDGGLDVAAWVDFRDKAPNQLLVLAQAGCTCDEDDMLKKQYDVNQDKWKQRIRGIWPINMMITPLCYRSAGGQWVKPDDIVSVFIDRIRLMRLLADQVTDFTNDDIPLFSTA